MSPTRSSARSPARPSRADAGRPRGLVHREVLARAARTARACAAGRRSTARRCRAAARPRPRRRRRTARGARASAPPGRSGRARPPARARCLEVVAQRLQHAALAVGARDHRQLDHHVQHQRGDEDDRAVVVRHHEVEPERVPVLRVHHARGELEDRAGDQQRDREPLERLRRVATGGNANSRGMTDHSLASRNGIATRPTLVCRPWLWRRATTGRSASRKGQHGRSRSTGTIAFPARSGMYAACERKPVVATTVIRTSSIVPSAWSATGRAGASGRSPGGTGRAERGARRWETLLASERYEGAARERAERPRLRTPPAPPPRRRRPHRPAHRNHSRHEARRLQPDLDARVGAPGGSVSTTIAPPGASSSPTRRSSRIGAPPMPMLPSSSRIVRHVPARGTCDQSDPLIARPRARAQAARRRGEVDAEPALPAAPARRDGGRGRSRGRAPGLDALQDGHVARIRGRQPAVERQRLQAPVREPQPRARLRAGAEQVLRGGGQQAPVERVGRQRERATVGASARTRLARSRSCRHLQRVGDHGQLGREARVRASAATAGVLEGVDVAQRRQDRRAQAEDRQPRALDGAGARSSSARRRRPRGRACAGRSPSSRRRARRRRRSRRRHGGQARVEQRRGDLRRVHADQERRLADVLERRGEPLLEPVTALRDDLEARRSQAPGSPSSTTIRRPARVARAAASSVSCSAAHASAAA